jgi:hypothetical protein
MVSANLFLKIPTNSRKSPGFHKKTRFGDRCQLSTKIRRNAPTKGNYGHNPPIQRNRKRPAVRVTTFSGINLNYYEKKPFVADLRRPSDGGAFYIVQQAYQR